MPRMRAENARGGRGDQQSHGSQCEQLATARGRLSEALDGILEVPGAPFGERERGVGHTPELHPLLGPCGGDRALEVCASLVGIETLRGAGPEDRQGGGLVFGLGLKLLVGALLERLHGLEAAALFDPDLPLLGCHSPSFYGLPNRDAGGRRGVRAPMGESSQSLCSPRAEPPTAPLSSPLRVTRLVCARRARAGRGHRRRVARGAVRERRRRQLIQRTQRKGPAEGPATQTTAKTTSTEPVSNSKSVIVLALVAAVLLLIAIAFVIVRDARRHAPEGDPQLTEAGAAHDATVRLRKRRAKAKAARQQRKRNR